MDVSAEKDGFSFRPQREKSSTIPKELKDASIFQQPKKWSSKNKRSRGNTSGETNNFPLLEYPDVIQAQLEVEEHFNKTFCFTQPSQPWILPPAHTMFSKPCWQDGELQKMKVSLNGTKKNLGEQEVSAWQLHTSNTNPAQKICSIVRCRSQAEMVTQAWLKFYEILNTYPIVPEDGMETEVNLLPEAPHKETCHEEAQLPFNTLHLCEAPGAFITALNHYLVLNKPNMKWQWLGSTLNPYYEGTPLDQCITEDRFIYLTRDHWLFGRDNTGDLTKLENLDNIKEQARGLGPIHLVTGDGSFDCQANPAEQELMTHPLHLCETIAGLSVLTPGGSLVIKKFTFFESQSLCLMYFLCCVFREVHVFKPGTSKQGNSEVYVICLAFKGKESCSEHLAKLLEVYGSETQLNVMFAEENLPKEFLQQMRECSAKFMSYQVKAIMRNLSLFEKMPDRDKQYNELLKSKATAVFFEQNYCVQIPKWKTITQGNANKSRFLLGSDWCKTYSSLLVRTSSLKSKIDILHTMLDSFMVQNSDANPMNTDAYTKSSFIFPKLDTIEFETIKGKPFQFIESSKFCSERVLRIYREITHVQVSVDNESQTEPQQIISDDSLVATVLNHHPGAVVVKGESIFAPHSGCQALEDAVVSLEEGYVVEGGSLVVVGAPLLSRLQCSLFLVLAAAFKKVWLYNGHIGTVLPVLVLDSLETNGSEAVVHALHGAGWSPGTTNKSHHTLLQLVALPSLLAHQPLQAVHLYNAHLCSHLATVLKSSIS
ncbi:hypothetical protein Pmani_002452 [Petrolisthes manimaculis]|uniref:Cap-specific mRNA (nucleoside-2'-O-)-methyltransferase 2 n=1 Tax=Petrolisthes manimaculis TaxID=1843537 RepID=A0AAE1UJD4_9EUCA|nr:hypothetical protein Pmani_002452 [Petrolisthes manimaculis]